MTPEMMQALADALAAIFDSVGTPQTVDATPAGLVAALDQVEQMLVPGDAAAEGGEAMMSADQMKAIKSVLGVKPTASGDEVADAIDVLKTAVNSSGKFAQGVAALGGVMTSIKGMTRHNGNGRAAAQDEEQPGDVDKNTGESKASKRYSGAGGQQGNRFGRNTLSEAMVHMVAGNRKALKAMGYTDGPNGGWLANRETSEQIVEMFYAQAVVVKAGAKVIPMDGLETLDFNKHLSGATAYWGGQAQTTTQSGDKFGQVSLNLRELVAEVPIPNRLLRNSSAALEQIVTSDMEIQMQLAADYAFLRGTGAKPAGHNGKEPLGIRNTSGVNVQAIATNGKVPKPDDFIAAWGRIEDAKVPRTGSWGLICSPRTKRTIQNSTDTTGQLIPEVRFTNGYAVNDTVQISNELTEGTSTGNTSEAYFGAWEFLYIGVGADVEITVFKETLAQTRQTLFQAVMLIDSGVVHPEAFQVLTGIKA